MTSSRVTLVGFDIGTTTSRAAFADAQIVNNAGSGGKEFGHVVQRPHTSSIMTPFSGEALDEHRLVSWMDQCFMDANIRAADVFGGGGLLTGLAARASNAGAVADGLRARVANAVIATADDPKLEAWLAFQGSVGAISRAYPSRSILNLDIGGGTTNAACGRAGNVFWTEWSWVGARHIVVRPGTYVIERCSSVGQETLDRLSIRKMKGDELTPVEVDAIVKAWVGDLENMLQQAALPSGAQEPEVAFSGGVGELVYAVRTGKTVPGTTHWGDLGIDLARAICGLNIWGFGSPAAPFAPNPRLNIWGFGSPAAPFAPNPRLNIWGFGSPSAPFAPNPRSTLLTERIVVPTNMGRATLYGLVEHQTQVSGTTIFLPNPDVLPLGDIPIVAAIDDGITDDELRHWITLAAASRKGAAVHVRAMGGEASRIRDLGRRVGKALENHPKDRSFVLLLEENAAKAIGGYATDWGLHPRPLVVLDELMPHAARFAHIGRMHGGMVFISFHGFGSKE